jgi:hypothetical protein
MELLRTFPPEAYTAALEAWAWLPVDGKAPICTSPFGDVFLEAADGIYILDLLEGSLSRAFADRQAMQDALSTADGQDQFLLAGLALGAERTGVTAGPAEVYSFKVAPFLGGPISVDNIEVMDFVVYVNLSGQLHQQVAALPPGTRISGITIDGQPPTREPKRRRLFGKR